MKPKAGDLILDKYDGEIIMVIDFDDPHATFLTTYDTSNGEESYIIEQVILEFTETMTCIGSFDEL